MTQTVEVPERVERGEGYAVSGSGYEPGANLIVTIDHDGDTGWHGRRQVAVAADGTFSLPDQPSNLLGVLTVAVVGLLPDADPDDPQVGVLASGSLTVEDTQ